MKMAGALSDKVRGVTPESIARQLNGKGKDGAAQRSALRRLVDQWIDSGKKNGVDSPWDRITPSCDREQFLRSGTLDPIVGPDERITIYFWPMPRAEFLRTPNWNLAQAPQRKFAFWKFEVLIDCPTRERLSRCDTCGKYFVRQRMPKKGVSIKTGVFCDRCKVRGSVARTLESRERRKRELVKLAARFWPEWERAKRRTRRSEWVAAQMNQRNPLRAAPITMKWVTQNRAAIEAAITSASRGQK